MCRDHLNPGGSVCLWIPLYESNLETTKSLIATFFQVFPNGILWSNEREGFGYDAILFGQVEPTVIDVDALQKRLDQPDHRPVKKSLSDVGFWQPRVTGEFEEVRDEWIGLLSTYSGQAALAEGVVEGTLRSTPTATSGSSISPACRSIPAWARESSPASFTYYRFPDKTFVGSRRS